MDCALDHTALQYHSHHLWCTLKTWHQIWHTAIQSLTMEMIWLLLLAMGHSLLIQKPPQLPSQQQVMVTLVVLNKLKYLRANKRKKLLISIQTSWLSQLKISNVSSSWCPVFSKSMVSYPREKPRSQALTIIQCKLYSHCFEVGIQRYAHCIPCTVNGARNMPYSYHNFDKQQKVCKLILEVCYHLWHVYYEWITLCKHYHMHIHCMYMFYFVGPDIPVIVGVTVGLGVSLLIVIIVAVACLVWYGKQKGWDNTNSVHKIAENFHVETG